MNQSTQSFESLSVYEIQSGVDLTSNTDAARTTVAKMFIIFRKKNQNEKKKRIIDTIVLSKDPRCSVKSASLAAIPSITDQNYSASSDYNPSPFILS